MNTPRFNFASFAAACAVTLALFAGVTSMAVAAPAASQMAQTVVVTAG